jgi:hypothetical protein
VHFRKAGIERDRVPGGFDRRDAGGLLDFDRAAQGRYVRTIHSGAAVLPDTAGRVRSRFREAG